MIKYKYGKSIYNIKISNPDGKSTGVQKFIVNGNEIAEKWIRLASHGGIFEIEVIM